LEAELDKLITSLKQKNVLVEVPKKKKKEQGLLDDKIFSS
jgi:hypothetical protein